jgi:hypothetical protein
LTESSSSLLVQNILQPFFEILFSEGRFHDGKHSSLGIDQQNSRETGVQTELVLQFGVISSLSPEETDGFISEVIDCLNDKKFTPLMISR